MSTNSTTLPRRIKIALALSLLILSAGGVWFHQTQKQSVLREVEKSLSTIANLKANQIAAWRNERLGDASVLSENPFFVQGVVRFMRTGSDENRRKIIAGFRSLKQNFRCDNMLLVDPEGRQLLRLRGDKRLYTGYVSALGVALGEGRPVFIDLQAGPAHHTPHISVLSPLYIDSGESRKPIGAIIMIIDAAQFLYPLIQSWPTASRTAETLLVRRDGDDVLFLNDLRHQTDTALKLRIPLSRKDLPASMAVAGQTGITMGSDYRGVTVLSAILRVPDTPWFMVAKVDADEVFADWHIRSLLIVAFILGAFIFLGAAGLLLWQWEKKKHYHQRYLSEAELRNSLERHSVTLKSIGDAVIATDAHGKVELLNAVAEALTGWTETEARGRQLEAVFDIVHEQTREQVENPVKRVLREGTVVGMANHTLLIARDGTGHPIADSGAPIFDANGEITGVVLVFRDQTEERRNRRMTQIRWNLIDYAATHSLEDLLTRVLDEIDGFLDSPIGFFHFVDADRKTISLQQWSTRTRTEFCHAKGERLHYPLDQAGVWADCARLGKPVVHNDYESVPNKKGLPEDHADINRELVVPVIRDDKVVAILGVGNKPCDYTEQDMESLAYLADVTWEIIERKRVEEALVQSELRLRTLIDAIPDLVWLKDRNGIYLLCNKTFERFFGAKESKIIGKTDHDFVDNGLADFFRAHDRKAMAAGRPSVYEESLNFADGNRNGVFETLKAPMYDVNGTLIGVLGISRDISERKQTEELLRQNEQRYVSAQRMGRVGNWEFDIATEAFWGSDEAKRIFGFDIQRNAFTVEEVESCIPERESVHQALVDIIEHEKPYDLEYEVIPEDGAAPKIVRSIARLARNASGGPTKLIGVIQDITGPKEAEKERLRLEQQLLQAQKMEAIGRLAGGVAHDYNNVLSVILGYTELSMEKTDPSGALYANLNEILAAARRSADITRQLLAFARKQAIEPKVLDLNRIVTEMHSMLRRLIGEDIHLSWRPEKPLWPVKMDPSQLEQILANLCVNARDAITGVGKIAIETGMVTLDNAYCSEHAGFIPGEFVLLAVSDDGCGMDKETLDSIFEPFFTTKKEDQGTGLGLATVYGIVKQNNGFINAYSEPGDGATFKIYLPRHAGEADAIKREATAEIVTGQGESVLFVEDEPAIRQLGQSMLERLGYDVRTAGSPAEAIQLASAHPDGIDLLITDVIMPGMNGRELANRLHERYPNLKTLFMSGYTANIIAHRGVLDEGVQFIHKPFSIKELSLKIREILDM